MARNSLSFVFAMLPTTGGGFVNIDHIAALNRMGFDAKAFFVASGEGTEGLGVPVASGPIRIDPDDIMVFGEDGRGLLDSIFDVSCVKVLHNQNPYYTFKGFGSVARLNSFAFRRIIVPSDFCAGRLAAMGATAPVSRVRPCLPDYFRPGPKQLQIAYSPRKRPIEALFMMEYFRARAPEYANVPWVELTQVTRQVCAEVMAQSAIYAAFPFLESLGLMSLEAMASGCHVVGYTGLGGAEYATPGNGDWIADGDHDDFVERLRQACRLFETGGDNPRLEQSHATAAQFSREGFEAELKEAWLAVMGDKADRYHK